MNVWIRKLLKWSIFLVITTLIGSFLYLNFPSHENFSEKLEKDFKMNPRDVEARRKVVEKAEKPAAVEIEDAFEAKLGGEEVENEVHLTDKVHIFYYPWYGNPEFDDGKYYHWNHAYLPHWQKEITKKFPSGAHRPPGDIGANFYPQLGPYSSRDPSIIRQHLQWIAGTGVGVVAISWFPKHMADEQGREFDSRIPAFLDEAHKFSLKLAFHLEPYHNRTAQSVAGDIKYLIDSYGHHPAFYRTVSKFHARPMPLVYVYDSYLVPMEQWRRIARKDGDETIRGTQYDAILIGLLVDQGHGKQLADAGFDGLYTYFAADGFSYGSKMSNWAALAEQCDHLRLLFIPSIGPGYDDRRVRPWNGANRRDRNGGQYYERHWEAGHSSGADFLSITSFNEWHEGTQIEPAISYTDSSTGFIYSTYDSGPEQYLEATKRMVDKYFDGGN